MFHPDAAPGLWLDAKTILDVASAWERQNPECDSPAENPVRKSRRDMQRERWEREVGPWRLWARERLGDGAPNGRVAGLCLPVWATGRLRQLLWEGFARQGWPLCLAEPFTAAMAYWAARSMGDGAAAPPLEDGEALTVDVGHAWHNGECWTRGRAAREGSVWRFWAEAERMAHRGNASRLRATLEDSAAGLSRRVFVDQALAERMGSEAAQAIVLDEGQWALGAGAYAASIWRDDEEGRAADRNGLPGLSIHGNKGLALWRANGMEGDGCPATPVVLLPPVRGVQSRRRVRLEAVPVDGVVSLTLVWMLWPPARTGPEWRDEDDLGEMPPCREIKHVEIAGAGFRRTRGAAGRFLLDVKERPVHGVAARVEWQGGLIDVSIPYPEGFCHDNLYANAETAGSAV